MDLAVDERDAPTPELLGECYEGGLRGVYGVCLGTIFFGESMFAHVPDASKAAFVTLTEQLRHWGITLVDCQVHTPHLARFGATEWPRSRYLSALRAAIEKPTRRAGRTDSCLLYTSPSPRDLSTSRMPSSA